MIYLINADTNEIINTYENVIAWDYNFVEYTNDNIRAKIYCNDDEYFSDVED